MMTENYNLENFIPVQNIRIANLPMLYNQDTNRTEIAFGQYVDLEAQIIPANAGWPDLPFKQSDIEWEVINPSDSLAGLQPIARITNDPAGIPRRLEIIRQGSFTLRARLRNARAIINNPLE